MPQPNYAKETQIMRRIVAHPDHRYIWTKHALERMAERKIEATDIEHCLTFGHVVLVESKRDILWRVKGSDIDGDGMDVLIAVYEDENGIKVITVF
jgi:hypothetical protein